MSARPKLADLLVLGAILAGIAGAGRGQAQEPQMAREGGQAVPAMSGTALGGGGQSPFLGGVPSGQATPDVIPLSLSEAIARGLAHNLGALIGQQAERSADGARWSARSAMLPNVSARLAETRQQNNLEAFGFPLPAGADPIVGPFNVFDARVYLSQPVFDYGAIQSIRAGNHALQAAQYSAKDARDIVVTVCAGLYLQVVSSGARIEAARAQLRTAEAVYRRAVEMKSAGVVAGIDVLRAQVQLQAQQQRVIFYENELAKQKLGLARAIGLPLSQRFELSDRVPYAALQTMTLDEALAQAYASRADYLGAIASLKAAEAGRQAILGEALPSVRFNADYGAIGLTAGTARNTFSLSGSVRIPLFQGGRVRGRMMQADAAIEQDRARLEDFRSRIEYDVRAAVLDVKAADDRVHVAQQAADLAAEQLTQAQDRFSAGVASNLEVVQAQEAVATASENYLSSLHAHNVAKVGMARALGIAEASAGQFLGGSK